MHKKEVSVVVVAMASPFLVGLYEELSLIETLESPLKSSDALSELFGTILERYTIKNIIYTNGPGSFMAIKVAYIFLKSLSIVKSIPFYAVDAFYFNNNRPIKAIGKLCFVKISSKIETQKFEQIEPSIFVLPQKIDFSDFSKQTAPDYSIGAVG